MPAQIIQKHHLAKGCSHIDNKRPENRNLFNDQQDYEVFLGFLKDYLTSPTNTENIKKEFSVKSCVFRGMSSKNDFKNIEHETYNILPFRNISEKHKPT